METIEKGVYKTLELIITFLTRFQLDIWILNSSLSNSNLYINTRNRSATASDVNS